jgi:hypothetical protein
MRGSVMREGIRVLERLEFENSFQLRLNPLVSANMSLSKFSKVKCSIVNTLLL